MRDTHEKNVGKDPGIELEVNFVVTFSCTLSLVIERKKNLQTLYLQTVNMVFNKDCLVGLTIDEKYEIEEYRDMMKAFADAATVGDLDQVTTYFPQ